VIGGATIILGWVLSAMQGYVATWSFSGLASSLVIAGIALTAGVLLWKGHRAGTRLSIVAQLLQVATVSLPYAYFGSTLGPTIGPHITSNTVGLNIGFYGRAGIGFAGGQRFPLDITINLLAIIALVALIRRVRHSTVPAAA
jgi:hypothetical protein